MSLCDVAATAAALGSWEATSEPTAQGLSNAVQGSATVRWQGLEGLGTSS